MRVVVIGAGAAGLVAATEAARRSAEVIVLEKSRKTGVKILMSGGTRCNLTHDTDAQGIVEAFGHARRFLQPTVGAFPPAQVVKMFTGLGVATKIESTGKIFPTSDRALHVRDALHTQAIDAGATIHTSAAVTTVARQDNGWIVRTADENLEADRLIITSGGKSYPGCGTTGDAYSWLRQLGHTIVTPRPALVPLVGGESWTHELSGLALEDCVLSAVPHTPGKRKQQQQRRGSLLFTHFGFSGPAAMDISGVITAADSPNDLRLRLDLRPDLSESDLQQVLTDRSRHGGRRRISSLVCDWLPSRLANSLVQRLDADCTVAELQRGKLRGLIENIKGLHLPVTGTRGFDKAEVTAGGVCLKEVNPKTMASRIVEGLFVAGEVLDVDGPIGGFNFQAAFSTGRAAGIAASSP